MLNATWGSECLPPCTDDELNAEPSLGQRSQNNAVGIATGYGLYVKRSRSSNPGRFKNCLSSTVSKPALGPTQLPIQLVPRVLPPGVRRPGREAEYSPSTSAQVKKMWIYTTAPPSVFMA
jgi:hypothetical protein